VVEEPPAPQGPLTDFESVKHEVMRSLLARIVVVRLLFAPLFLSVIGLTTWADPAPWRLRLAGGLTAFLVALFSVEYWRWDRGLSGPQAFPANVVGMLWIQLGVVVLTGGLDSPLLALLPMMNLQLAITFGPSLPLCAVLGAHVVTVWTLVALAANGVSLALPPARHEPWSLPWLLLVGTVLTGMLGAAVVIGTKVRQLVSSTVSTALAAHDSERSAHAEHAREIVTLTGEIAHELKNPLASIKGLAALLARDLSGKSAERLAVLRAEVDRMQETLDAFLDFSRPLVPLTQTEVDVAELGREVMALCDGIARMRGVTLVADPERTVVRADRRKLRQVLVNLVQNAIEASPSGGAVELRTGERRVEVLDRGPGVAEEIREHIFEAGVTTRARGSGLGLTIARALVQQHGGELRLLRREGGGTKAMVELPEG
jgi:two-component system sensor histidine kinase HydH